MLLKAALLLPAAALVGAQAPPTAEKCDAGRRCDVDGDGDVNVRDLLLTLSAFGGTTPEKLASGDVNRDGVCNVRDILDVLSAFNIDLSQCAGSPAGGSGTAPPAPAPAADSGEGCTRACITGMNPGFAGGRVFGVGNNDDGRLGLGDNEDRNSPVEIVAAGSDNVAISAGGHASYFLKADGRVFATGMNDAGQLGDGTTDGRSVPEEVTGISGTVVQMGRGWYSVMLLLMADGSVVGWGENPNGELCDGSFQHSLTPKTISPLGTDNAALGAGLHHTFVIKTTGSVYGCGNNYFGSLGDGTSVDRSSPTQITALGNEVAQMAGGFGHSLALKSDGSVMTFGENTYGQLGDGCHYSGSHRCMGNAGHRLNPWEATELGNDNAFVDGGNRNSMVLKKDGRIFTCGYGWTGALGRGDSDEDKENSSTWIEAIIDSDNAKAVLSGNSHHILALKNDGRVEGFGADNMGALAGRGGGEPQEMTEVGSDNADVAGQYHFSLVLKNN